MKITEPTTMITDFLIALEATILAIIILQSDPNIPQILWGLAFIITAIGAILGGIAHGFKEYAGKTSEKIIWKSTIILLGLGAGFMLSGLLLHLYDQTIYIAYFIIFIIILFIAYVLKIMSDDRFIFVILYYLPFLVTILLLEIINYKSEDAIYIIFGVLITFLGFGVQAKQFTLHKHFNHNDLFHIFQLIAIYMFYLGIQQFN